VALFERLSESIQLGEIKKDELSRAVQNGSAFFNKFNNSRMELAFSSFSEDMKKALFEIIYFLHVNDPKYAEHTYLYKRIEKQDGVLKEVEDEVQVSLYIEDAPAGVVGINNLSPVFKEKFAAFIMNEFGDVILDDPNDQSFKPIYSIASLGSIGTVGHKRTASDLDLQVQYELEPFLYKTSDLSDEFLTQCAQDIINFFSIKYRIVKGYRQKDLKNKKIVSIINMAGHSNLRRRFPEIYEVFIKKNKAIIDKVFNNQQSRQAFVHQIIAMMKLHSQSCQHKERAYREKLLKARIDTIQTYIQRKYPEAEVYLFAYSNDNYRDGKHGTTLESKEASGSAYELILNYELLMPGIQFSPVIPIHFLMPDNVNSDRKKYEQLIDYIRFHLTNLYDDFRNDLVDLGSTPPLTSEYMVAHSGAMYWESFKASSGNLPKATLRLLRLEMLFDKRFNSSVIELIKKPRKLDKYAGELETVIEEEEEVEEILADEEIFVEDEPNFFDDYGIENPIKLLDDDDDDGEEGDIIGAEESAGGLSIAKIFKMEELFPKLLQDPWWLNFKALKIGFGPENETVGDHKDRDMISRVIDLGFALHVKVSDVFNKVKSKSNKADNYREQFLFAFLEKTFPRKRRLFLEHIFNGDVDAVIQFEHDLKYIFKNSMLRMHQVIEQRGGKDKTNQDEFKIWYHYYEQNFEPPPNVVRRDILSHLKIPRGRLQIGYHESNKKWFFKSLQKSSLARSRYNTFGELDHLPDEVELFDSQSFLYGIAHCMLNDYYGVVNRGTLLESRTHLEFSVAHMSLGNRFADKWAYVRPDIVIRLFEGIQDAFPPQDYDFRDCIYKAREISNVFICCNLLGCGRISIMYRSNLKTWYVDEFDHPELEKQAEACYENLELLLNSPVIIETIKKFFKKHKFKLTESTRDAVHYWVNPNSFRTFHSADNFPQKEKALAKQFGTFIYQAVRIKESAPNNKPAQAVSKNSPSKSA
jgi:hypothetical protein